MQAHQQRVVDELEARRGEVERLGVFIDSNPLFKTLDEMDQNLMHDQRRIMNQLCHTLAARIARF
jgi:hypothetical protein